MAWKNGNIFDNVKTLREKIKVVQVQIDKDPDQIHPRKEESELLKLYVEAMKDEEKILYHKFYFDYTCPKNLNSK